MSRKKIITIFSTIIAITTILIIVGLIFQKSDEEKLNGLAEIFAISPDGTIAYVAYQEGQQHIIFKKGQRTEVVVHINKNNVILDMDFSPDGSSIIYSIINKNIEEELLTTVNILEVDSLTEKSLFQERGLITEVEFDPKNEDTLFYLMADTYENYSPIARANPHNFNMYSYNVQTREHTKYTNLDAYTMSSLKVSPSKDIAYIQMFNDSDTESAEDIFTALLHIFQVPLDNPDQMSIISDQNRGEDIYDFDFFPSENKVIFQSVSNAHEGGTFQYELFSYDLHTKEEVQITNLKQYTSRPVITADEKDIYFIVDKQFGKKQPDYHLYKMDIDGENIEEIVLEYVDEILLEN